MMAYALYAGCAAELYRDVPFKDSRFEERRTDVRTISVFRPAVIRIGDFRSLCLVRNVSQNGMMAKIYSPIAVEAPVTVEFSAHQSVVGTVVWAEEGRVGIHFKTPLDVAELLTETGKKGRGNKINRPLRLEIAARGEMEVDGSIEAFEVQDISQRGLKAKVNANLAQNDEVLIRLIGLELRKAVVRWIRNGEVGLHFTRPLGMDELGTWIVRQQAR